MGEIMLVNPKQSIRNFVVIKDFYPETESEFHVLNCTGEGTTSHTGYCACLCSDCILPGFPPKDPSCVCRKCKCNESSS